MAASEERRIDRDKEGQGPGLPSPVRRGESSIDGREENSYYSWESFFG